MINAGNLKVNLEVTLYYFCNDKVNNLHANLGVYFKLSFIIVALDNLDAS